jgi:serine/threonine protein kinase
MENKKEFERLSLRDRCILCHRIAKATQIMHSKNIIHRDLKPANILLKLEKGREVPVIADFGHSKKTKAESQ